MAERIYTQVFGTVGAILEHDGKILLVKEAQGAAKGLWNHPAGWIDVGESPVEAVRREVLEESGYEFTPQRLLGVCSLVVHHPGHPQPHHTIKLVFSGTVSNWDSPKPIQDDIAETRWFAPKEVEAMDANTLRDLDIKDMVRNYFSGKGSDLSLITHTRQRR